MSFKIINVQHRHCVFTIDSELRHFFLEDRELLGLLFEAVQSVILRNAFSIAYINGVKRDEEFKEIRLMN